MPLPLLATKTFVPRRRPQLVPRPRLRERLDQLDRYRLVLLCAPAGFGKTTLIADWIAGCGRPVAWLSLDEADADPSRFLAYLVAAVQTVVPQAGGGILAMLGAPQPPAPDAAMTSLVNDLAAASTPFILVLDDLHAVDSRAVDASIAFLVEHMPVSAHLVIATREDPDLPLARLRARDQLTEMRAADLRFTPSEAADFLNRAMGMDLSPGDVGALEARTEGWIAGLHLAAISIQGRDDVGAFIRSFTGSNAFVMDFLIEEVLRRQPEAMQAFLVRTSILDRLSGPLCDAVLSAPAGSGQETLEYLERANLFLTPLDSERGWYRYHRLFADLLRQQLSRRMAQDGSELHARASRWYEANGMELEAFRHAVAANDVPRAELLAEGNGRPLYFRGAMAPVLQWLESLAPAAMDARPSLWVAFAYALMMSGRPGGVEAKLRAAEAALKVPDQELQGRIAVLRAMVAAAGNGAGTVRAQVQRGTECLRPDDHAFRTFGELARGYASMLEGDTAAAVRTFEEVMSMGQASGNSTLTVAGASSLGQVQESELKLHSAAATYRHILSIVGDPSHVYNYEAHLGLGRIHYEWNELDAALQQAEQSAQLAPQIECMCPATSLLLLARIELALFDDSEATALLEKAAEAARMRGAPGAMAEVAAEKVTLLLHQGNVAEAARLTQEFDLPMSRARVHLAQGNPAAALAVLDQRRAEVGCTGPERLQLTVLQALAVSARGDKDKAVQLLGNALTLAEPGGFIRVFVDQGAPMAALLCETLAQGIKTARVERLLEAIQEASTRSSTSSPRPFTEALSQREVEILRLIAQGLTNQEIAERLFLAVSTVKGHNQSIFGKLQVQRRTEAIARARELGLV